MDLYAPVISERLASRVYALAQEQHVRTNTERPTKDEEQQNMDAADLGYAVYLAQRPHLAQLVAMLNAANGLRDDVLAEIKALQVDERESGELTAFFRDLSNMLHASLGDIMCTRWSDDMKQATVQGAA